MQPALKLLHPEDSLSQLKLAQLRRLSTDVIEASLCPGQRDCLKTRADGTILDGHHRIYVLKERGFEVDRLPRDIIQKGL
jgi:hypothetical protein